MDTLDPEEVSGAQLPPQDIPAVEPEGSQVTYLMSDDGDDIPLVLQLDDEEEQLPPAAEEKPKKEKQKGHAGLWVAIILLVAALLLQPVAMIAYMGNNDGTAGKTIVGANINTRGELVVNYSDGTQEILGNVVTQGGSSGNNSTDVPPTIVGNETDTVAAARRALRSTVSIATVFQSTGGLGSDSAYVAAGSGVIYQLDKNNGDALILTNYHLVYDVDSRKENGIAEQILVCLYGSEYWERAIEATYVGGSMYYDLAVLQVRNSDILRNSSALAVSIADSDAVQVGSTAIAVGNGGGNGISVTSGVVSKDSEHITMLGVDGVTEVDFRVIRVDTAVNNGNSGGGLYDRDGRMIGIINSKTIKENVENIAYAIPSSVIKVVADNIIDYCQNSTCENVMRPILGVTVTIRDSAAVYDEETDMLNIVETVEVYSVEPGKLGAVFREGDILRSVKIGDTVKQITRQHQLIDFMITARVGDEVQFVVLRDGEEKTLTVVIDQSCLIAY